MKYVIGTWLLFFSYICFSQTVCDTIADFTVSNQCLGSPTLFNATGKGDTLTWVWNFGDPSSGINNTAKGKHVSHKFNSTTKNYSISVTIPGMCGGVIKKNITIHNPPKVDLKDTTVCANPVTKINVGSYSNATYLWSTGETTQEINIIDKGLYWVKVFQNGCIGSDTAKIKVWGEGNKGDINWIYGQNVGTIFPNGNTKNVIQNKLNTLGSSASISTPTGSLLFYTDGMNVYSKDGSIMPNGTGLNGASNESESTIIIPDSRVNNLYYIFTISQTNELTYSLIDLSYNHGAGLIIEKNIPLQNSISNGIAATFSNGNEFSIITHDILNDDFLLFKIDTNGLNKSPIILSNSINPNGNVSSMKFSSDGTKLAVSYSNLNAIELFTFDSKTNSLTNRIEIKNIINPVSLEFSPNSSYLYAATGTEHTVAQFDISSKNSNKIDSSKYVVSQDTSITYTSLELSPLGEILIGQGAYGYVGSILNPNKDTTACMLTNQKIKLSNGNLAPILPNWVENYFIKKSWGVSVGELCIGKQTKFSVSVPDQIISVAWNFGDPTTGIKNTSTLQVDTHIFSSIGTYTINVTVHYLCGDTTFTKTIVIYDYPNVNLGADTTFCSSSSIQLDAQNPGLTYSWSTKELSQQITVDTSGQYSVSVSNHGCIKKDTINIKLVNIENINLGSDTTLCIGQYINLYNLNKSVIPNKNNWSTGETSDTIKVNTAGIYFLQNYAFNCTIVDTIKITYNRMPAKPNLGDDDTICVNGTKKLNAAIIGFNYLWSTRDTTIQTTVNSAGTYTVKVYDGICASYDTISIIIDYGPNITLPAQTAYCPNQQTSITLYAGKTASYLWLPLNSNSDSIQISTKGIYTLTGTNEHGCKKTVETEVQYTCEPFLYVPSAFSPNGDQVNDIYIIQGVNLETYEMYIFDKWGETIFYTNDLNKNWNGEYRGDIVPEDVYSWKINYSNLEHNNYVSKTKLGNVTLLK